MDRLHSAIEILRRLIAFDTTSHKSNLDLIEAITAMAEPYAQTVVRDTSADGTKASLFIRIGPENPGGIALSGHSDVVPVANQRWAADPFILREEDGKLYGRGTADMKGFIACCVSMLPVWATMSLRYPIDLLISYDEEIGCLQAAAVARKVRALGWQPRMIVIGEPTGMSPAHAHKGIFSFKTTIIGREAHSSQTHRGVNAIHTAVELIHFLLNEAEQLKQHRDEHFEPDHTTLQVGTIHGGTARNIVPNECSFLWEVRSIPGFEMDPLLARFEQLSERLVQNMRQIHTDCAITTLPQSRVLPLKPESEQELVQQMLRLAESNRMSAVPYGTEAGIIQSEGFSCFVCGPGDISQAHIPDEYVETVQLERCLRFLDACGRELGA